MTTEQTAPSSENPVAAVQEGRRGRGPFGRSAALVLLVLDRGQRARRGGSPRISNPKVTGAPRPVEPLFGYDHWIGLFQIVTDHLDGHDHRGLRRGMAALRPTRSC